MRPLLFTLLSEGASDQALIPVLAWALRQHSSRPFQPQWADLGRLPRPPSRKVAESIPIALKLYPCDLLFVHRDGDNEGRGKRVAEITEALRENALDQPTVCVVPVRTLEAWFLFNEDAIRRAAGNPNGSMKLEIPRWPEIERIRKPKERLRQLIKQATGLSARRRRGIRWGQAIHHIAELISDFSPLRRLPAFEAFEADLKQTLANRLQ